MLKLMRRAGYDIERCPDVFAQILEINQESLALIRLPVTKQRLPALVRRESRIDLLPSD